MGWTIRLYVDYQSLLRFQSHALVIANNSTFPTDVGHRSWDVVLLVMLAKIQRVF